MSAWERVSKDPSHPEYGVFRPVRNKMRPGVMYWWAEKHSGRTAGVYCLVLTHDNRLLTDGVLVTQEEIEYSRAEVAGRVAHMMESRILYAMEKH